MTFDEKLAQRIRAVLAREDGVTEKRMFGGLCFLHAGNMCCGIVDRDLMLRLGNAGARAALEMPYVRPMDFTGKPLASMVYVEAAGIAAAADLRHWIERALAFAQTLPRKRAARPRSERAAAPRSTTSRKAAPRAAKRPRRS